jgi:anti-sigma B factor antagonist
MGGFVSTARIPERLQLGYRLISGVTVVDVIGEVDVLTCGLLRDRLLAVTDDARRSLVVNLADVSFIDSTGLGVLVGVWHRMQAAQGILVLAAPSPQARTVLDATRLTQAFSVCATEAQAVQACRESAGG